MRSSRFITALLLAAVCLPAGAQKVKTWSYSVDTPEGEGLCEVEPKAMLKAQEVHGTLSGEDIVLHYKAGLRSPEMEITFELPACLRLSADNAYINVIGRGETRLDSLSLQSMGRYASLGRPRCVGEYSISTSGTVTRLTLTGLDLRPDNGDDVVLRIPFPKGIKAGELSFRAAYRTAEPEVYQSGFETFCMKVTPTISDFAVSMQGRYFSWRDGSPLTFSWTPSSRKYTLKAKLKDTTLDWITIGTVSGGKAEIAADRLSKGSLHAFALFDKGRMVSNTVEMMNGEWLADDYIPLVDDCTEDLDRLIRIVSEKGGGIIRLREGDTTYVSTVHLLSNVWLDIPAGATVMALKGGDEPERTWFSDRKYRSGLSPTDHKPYDEPANWLTKQDVGHTFFRNSMFFAERQTNIRIFGSGRISGNGNLVTSDKVMNNGADKRKDKMFTFKLCTDIEIGGEPDERDLWYDEARDLPYHITPEGNDYDVSRMLRIDQGGHFVLLATGTDGIYVHDTFFGKDSQSNVRDIYDFMACNDVVCTNIYSHLSSDDIVKLGSDCSLGFTRPVGNYLVRNIIGDTNCNLFQIGSETADDIKHVWVDNIFVLGANKAGFSISTNDAAVIEDVHLNSGKTGPIHHISQMRRTRCPIFLSISNRGRTLGADAKVYSFQENGTTRKELLITNSPIASIRNVTLRDLEISEVYGGSSFRHNRWDPYTGKENEAPIILAGFAIPSEDRLEGGRKGFELPDGRFTGYIEDVTLCNVKALYKGGHPASDSEANPPEIGVGRYNVGDLKTLPAYGLWGRHIKGIRLIDCQFSTETPDGRDAVKFDDVSDISDGTEGDFPRFRYAWGCNNPIGEGKGIHPGRVAWSHAPGAASWEKGKGCWWMDEYNDQSGADWLVASALETLTGEKKAKAQWKALFTYFNKTHGRGERSYIKGERIAIKLNMNNTEGYEDGKDLNSSPHMVLALLRSLCRDGGIPEDCIDIVEPSRFITNALYDKCSKAFPKVRWIDNEGTDGRIKAEYVQDAIPYSRDNGKLARGICRTVCEADYLIDFALLKGHVGQGVTLCAKNWYGVTDINRDFHKNQHNNFNQDRNGKVRYMTFTDFIAHKDMGGKTMLFLIDGLYGSRNVNGEPFARWNMAPFCGEWPCSLFASQDPVAIDAVGMDFLGAEYPDMPDVNYMDMYLVEAAMAGSPLSGTVYDPERDGTPAGGSLGVLEHWNNPTDKLYSRNMGKDNGIELIYKCNR